MVCCHLPVPNNTAFAIPYARDIRRRLHGYDVGCPPSKGTEAGPVRPPKDVAVPPQHNTIWTIESRGSLLLKQEIDPRYSRLFLSAVWIPLAGADFQDCQVSNFVTRVQLPSLPNPFNRLDHLLESHGGPHSRGVTKLPLSKNSQKDDHGRKSFVGRAGRLLRAQAVSVLAPGPVLPKS